MASNNYTVNYDDERFKEVETQKQDKITETKDLYGQMVNQSDSYFQSQIDASKEWAEKQQEIQQANTDFAIGKIEQQKDKAQKDYVKEQKGAYADYQKPTNPYGANAAQMSSSGIINSGYSESSKVSMYNTYQNRYASARESYNQAVLNYDNAIKEAQLANNSAMAEIAYNALQTQLELSLEGFQYKNTLLMQQADAINKVEDTYYAKYQDVLNQINTEMALAEEARQYNETLAFQKQQAAQEQANWEKEYALSKAAASRSYSSGGSYSGGTSLSNGGSAKTYQVNTDYYQGNLNKDAQYGTFSNGYQPNNVNGKKLSKTGDTITFNTKTLNGVSKTVTQNIWKTPDGTRYYWDGRYNKYIKC